MPGPLATITMKTTAKLILLPLLFSFISNNENVITTGNNNMNNSLNFLYSENYNIKNIEYKSDSHSSDPDTSYCKDWRKLTEPDIREVFKSMIPISGRERHNFYDHLPCRVIGVITNKTNQYEFEINSGSWIYIFVNDTTYIFGDTIKTHQEYFLSSPWTIEDMD